MEESQHSSKTLIKWLITFLVPIIVYLIPTTELYTAPLKTFFVITTFIIIVMAFEFFDPIIPAIMLPTLYMISGIVNPATAFGSWTSNTVWMIFGAMLLANVLEECGLLPRIAYWCIYKCGGNFTGIMFGIFFAGVALNFVTFCQAFIIMMVFGYGIVQALNLDLSKESALLCFAAMLGGEGAPSSFMYNPGYLGLAEEGIRQVVPGFFAKWYEMLIYNGPILLFFILFLFILAKVFNTKSIELEGGKEYFRNKYKSLGPVSTNEKKAMVVLIVLMGYLFTTPIHKYPAAYGFMILPYVLFLPKVNVGTKASIKKINFSIFFFIASCLGIGVVGGALGFGKLISGLVTPMLQNSTPLLALVVMMFFGMIGNLFMTPYAMMAGLSLPFAQIAVDLGLNPMATVMTLVISTDMVFFPYEVAPYLLMFGFGKISMGHFIKMNTAKTLLTFVFFIAILYPYWNLFHLVK